MICDTGDVVTVPFPFVDLAAQKRRPSVILSNRNFNEQHRHTICAMITSAAHSRWPTDIPIADLAAAGLAQQCVVRWKVFTLPNQNILRRLGKLDVADCTALMQGAKNILMSGAQSPP